MKTCLYIFLIFLILEVKAIDDSCVKTPTKAECKDYQIPVTSLDPTIEHVCTQMSPMPGCTVSNICENDQFSGGVYCQPFGIYAELCKDMPTMSVCANYSTMCPSNSVITQCSTPILPLPSSIRIQNLINGICTEMSMEACKACNAPSSAMQCPTLQIYSNLCKAMPTMSQCQDWKMICSLVPDWPICSTSTGNNFHGYESGPAMRMYLHSSIQDYVLFEKWVPKTGAQYFGTLVAICLFGVFGELIRFLKCFCDAKWQGHSFLESTSEPADGSDVDIIDDIRMSLLARLKEVPFKPKIDIPRALFRSFEVFWSVIVMLIVMSFNIGIILALCVGTFIGALLVGRFAEHQYTVSPQKKSSGGCCEM